MMKNAGAGRWLRGLVVASTVAVLVSACGRSDYSTEHFKSTSQIADVIGWSCGSGSMGSEKATRGDLGEYGFSSLPCDGGWIVIWASDAKRAELEGESFNALDTGECQIDGGNWAVGGSQYQVKDAQKKLGGKRICA